jgi:hypothetical protein
MNAAGELTQIVECRQQRIGHPDKRGLQLGLIRGYRALGGPQFQHQSHQPLLGAVVQVTFDASPGLVRGGKNPGP